MFPLSISLYLFVTCFMLAYSKEVDTGNNCVFSRVLSSYEIVISICALLYDLNGAAVKTQMRSMSSNKTRSIISVCCNNYILNRHAHLSIYLVISKRSVLLRFQYISHLHE